jgi:hypothetical protein
VRLRPHTHKKEENACQHASSPPMTPTSPASSPRRAGIYFKESKWRLAVKAAKPPQRGDDRSGGRGGRGRGEARLFVGGLPDGVTEADLLRKFRDCDPIDAFVPPRQTAVPYYGFVTVRDEGDNLRTAFDMDQKPFDDRCVS